MSFLNVLRKDCCILMRCLTQQFTTGTKVKVDSYSCKHFIRTITDDSKEVIRKPVTDKVILRLKRQDGISDDYMLIYRVKRGISFVAVHCMMLSCFVAVPVSAVVIGKRSDFKFPFKIADDVVIRNKFELAVCTILFGAIILSTLILVGRFPLRIYYNKLNNDYIAAYSNLLLPWKTTKIHFKPGQVRPIREEDKLFYQLSNYMINGKKVIFVEEHFERPMDLEYMVDLSINEGEKA